MPRRKPSWVPVAVGLILSLAGPGNATARAQFPLSPDTPVKSLRHEWNSAFSARDTARLGRLLQDSTVFLSTEVRLRGRDAVTGIFSSLFASRPGITLTFTPKGILPAQPAMTDSVVSEYGTWRESWNVSDGQVVLVGTYYDVWTREAEGWRIAIHAFTTTNCSGSLSYCNRP